jgi:heat shock protein HslJ
MLNLESSRLACGIAALVFVLSAAACGGNVAAPSPTTGASSAATAAVVSGSWKLQSLTRPDATTVTVERPDLFTLELTDGRIALRVDCNRATGPYTTNGGTLTVGAIAMTKAYCAATAALGDDYVRQLDGENVVSVTATSLVLSSTRGTLRFGR